MKTLLLLLGLLLLPGLLQAHIGSPNVFYEGQAGPHPVRIAVRPPTTLPGIAQVDVRTESTGPLKVAVRARFAEAEASWIDAAATPTNPQLHAAGLWLLRRGTYRLEVAVSGDGRSGEVVVPLNIAPTQQPKMPLGLGVILGALGLILAGSAVGIVRKIARESMLNRHDRPSPADDLRGRRAAGLTLIVVLGFTGAAGWRWWTMDRLFRQAVVDRPITILAEPEPSGGLQRLHLRAPQELADPGWDSLVTDHGKLVHLFLVREPAGETFAHLHPVRRSDRSFETLLPSLPAGKYTLYGEITHLTGASQTLTASVLLPASQRLPAQAAPTALDEILCQTPSLPAGNSASPALLDADAAWVADITPPLAENEAQICALPGGGTMVFENAGRLVENRETTLRFSIFGPAGDRLPMRPYMGMAGHAVLRHVEGTVFAHLHPLGTISMAAQQLFTPQDSPPSPGDPAVPPTGGWVAFPYAFPRAGEYRVWVQGRTEAGIVTGSFRVVVRASTEVR